MLKKIILIISYIFITFSCYNIFAATLDYNAIYSSDYADVMIADGVGADIGSQLLDGGYFGEEVLNYKTNELANKFISNYAKNYHFYITEDTDKFKSNDEYLQGMHDLYVEVANQLKNQPKMKFISKAFNTYSGINNDEYARCVFEKIAMEIVGKKIDEVRKAHKKGCNDTNAGNFTYNGKEYRCDEITYEYKNFQKVYSYDWLKDANTALSSIVDNSLAYKGQLVSNEFKYGIQKNNYEVTGKGPNPDKTQGGNSNTDENDGKIIFSYNYNGWYRPNIINAVKFANKLADAGEVEGLSGNVFSGGSIKSALGSMIKDFSNIGTYILYGAIIFFGVRTIWSGINGKVEFKETLPYILLAIVFFYLAPNLIDLLEKILDNKYGQNYLGNIWGSVIKIVQIAAFGGILYAGVKLIFAAPDQKANIKQSLIPILVGSILVFASSTVVSIVINVTKDVTSKGVGNSSKTPSQETIYETNSYHWFA